MPRPDSPTHAATRFGTTIFIVGATLAVTALGLTWRLDVPPLLLIRSPLRQVVGLVAATLPLGLMALGAVVTWPRASSPRVMMLVVALIYAGVAAPASVEAARDLIAGAEQRPAIVLGVYDCDALSPGGVTQALTCVELAWRPRAETPTLRERYLISDAERPPGLRAGQCVEARFWVASLNLHALAPAPADACLPLLTPTRRPTIAPAPRAPRGGRSVPPATPGRVIPPTP